MGYQAELSLRDDRGQRWVGAHTPASADLLELLTPLLAEDGLDDGVEGLAARLPSCARLEARLGPNALGLSLDGPGAIHRLVLKLVPPSARGAVDAVLHLHEGSRARRAHVMSHRLRAFGVGTPAPLGFLERSVRPRAAPSLHVSAWVPAPDLRAWWIGSGAPRAERRARLAQVAVALRTLHARGLFPGDLHAENLLVGPEDVLWLDLESIRSAGRRDRVRTKSLARLDRDAEELGVPRIERLRFLEVYLRHQAGARAQRRRLWTQIARVAADRRRARAAPASEEVAADL